MKNSILKMLAILTLSACSSPQSQSVSETPSAANARSFFTLTSGNGLGFTLYDAKSSRLFAFLDHPYRYLEPDPDERKFGKERRNLLESLQFSENKDFHGNPSYLDESGIIQIQGQGATEYYFMPYALPLNAFVALSNRPQAAQQSVSLQLHLGAETKPEVFWHSPFKITEVPGENVKPLKGTRIPAWIETGKTHGAIIYVPLDNAKLACQPTCSGNKVSLEIAAPSPWLGVVVAYVADAKKATAAANTIARWIGKSRAPDVLNRERQAWEEWRKPAPAGISETERKLWRQSEAISRMGQVREAKADGMILASIAPGGWSIGWVRDATYATVGLARVGHFAEAKRSLNFFLNAKSGRYKKWVGGIPYRISLTRYFGNGEEEADYAGSESPNIETDGWGLFLWAARQYVQASGDTAWLQQPVRGGRVIDVIQKEVADAIVSQLEENPRVMKPDSSIWEVHQHNAKHFVYTSITAARGLCDFAWLSRQAKRDGSRYKKLSFEIRDAIAGGYFNHSEGFLMGARERGILTDYDAAVIEYFGLDVVQDPKSPLAVKTLAAFEKLRVPSGGYARNAGKEEYDASEWAFVDMRTASVYHRLGEKERAQKLLDLVSRRAALNFNIIPETYVIDPKIGPLQAYTGSTPMVGYGSALFLLTRLETLGNPTPSSCE